MKKKLLSLLLVLLLCMGLVIPAAGAATTPDLAFLTEAVYDEFGNLSEGLIWFSQGTTVRYVNESGSVVIADALSQLRTYLGGAPDPDRTVIGDFHDGLARILYYDEDFMFIDYAYFIDQTGKTAFEIKDKYYYNVGECGNGYILAESPTEDYFTIYDKQGNISEKSVETITGSYGSIYWMYFSESLVPYYVYDGNDNIKCGYLNTSFKVAITAQYDDVRPFNNGLAFAKKDGYWGVIDKTGAFVIQPQYDDFYVNDINYSYQVFNDGLACVEKNGKWGFVDTKGATVISFKYDGFAGFFREGYATSTDYGCIDKSGGTIISSLQYEDINYVVNGVSLVGNDGVYSFVDTNGTTVSTKTWQFDLTLMTYALADAELAIYQQNGKYGLAALTFTETTYSATPTSSKVLVNGEEITFDAYLINDNNYFKLRDLAYVLSGSEVQFEVEWDGDNNAISLISGEAYTVIGGEMEGKGEGVKTATATTAKIYLDGKEVSFTAYNIGGNNYFKLRDIGQAFDFEVDWDGENNTIIIDTSTGYTPD